MASGDSLRANRPNEQSLLEIRQTLQRLSGKFAQVARGEFGFVAEIVSAGPASEADYADERHWVKEQKLSIDPASVTEVLYTDKTNGRHVRAHNLTGVHFTAGDLVWVCVLAQDDATFYVIERELGGDTTTGITDDITVVTGFDAETCEATTAVLTFTNGLLTAVT